MDKRAYESLTPKELVDFVAPFLNARDNAMLVSNGSNEGMMASFVGGFGLHIKRSKEFYDFAVEKDKNFIRIRAEFTQQGGYRKDALLHIKAVEIGFKTKAESYPFLDQFNITHRFVPTQGPAADDVYDDGAATAPLTAARLERVKAGLAHIAESFKDSDGFRPDAMDTVLDPAETDRIPAIGPYRNSAARILNAPREQARRRRNFRKRWGL